MAVEIRPKTGSLAVKVERNDHTTLTHRNEPDQHSIDAITGLSAALTDLHSLITDLKEKITLHDNSSTDIIEGLTQRLTDLIADSVNIEKARAEKEEQEIKDSISTKLEKVNSDFESKVLNLDSKIAELNAHDSALKAEILDLGNEVSNRVDEHQRDKNDFINRLENETDRAKTAEQEIRETAQAECARAQKAEENLTKLINDETVRAQTQEDNLRTIIDVVDKNSRERDAQLEKNLNNEISLSTSRYNTLNNAIYTEVDRAKKAEELLQDAVTDEVTTRAEADAAIITYVDEHVNAINLRTNVVDIVGTKADLSSYNKDSITENDIIKVLVDEDYDDTTTYYRLVENEFSFVGKVGPYYTEAEINDQWNNLFNNDINFTGTKDFSHITSNQVPQADNDLTNKLYVDNAIKGESDRAIAVEGALTNEITKLSGEVDKQLELKADLVDGKIPNSQLPDSHKTTSIFEYDSLENFPETGLEGSLYISTSDNIIYRWDGLDYVELSSSSFKNDGPLFIVCEVE